MEQGLARASGLVSWADYGFHEYLLVAYSDKMVKDKVLMEGKSISAEYTDKIGPHIVLAAYLARQPMEETLLRWMQRVCSDHPCFTVTLNNYSGIPEHTIYLRVQDHRPFVQIAKKLTVIEGFIRDNACPPMKISAKPYLAIARRLPKNVYEKSMMDFSTRMFHESFTVNELVLLRRQNQYDAYEQASVFGLMPATN